MPVRTMTPAEALGPLNEVERKYAPATLYLEGEPGLLRDAPRVAAVGSRNASEAGLRRAEQLARDLVAEGVTVVSGLARGIDGRAHRTAIQHEGRTIAVLGTPLNKVYPREHAELQQEIGRSHLLVSQFPSGAPISRKGFPQRNRTMALISDAAVIVEAGATSGTISLGWEALRLARPLFLAASLLDSDLEWPAKFVSYGAMELREVQQVLDVLPFGRPAPAAAEL